MVDITNWKEISKGFYLYVVGANVCYELQIIKHFLHENIYNSKANLYLVGDWHDATMQVNYFERELLSENKTVKELLEYAKKDFDENMK